MDDVQVVPSKQPGIERVLDLRSGPVAEMRVLRNESRPRRSRWRWDLRWYWKAEGVNAGVYDGRLHIIGDCGYAATQRGAWWALQRAYRRSPGQKLQRRR